MKNVPSGSLKSENFLTSSVIKTITFSKTNFPPPLWSKLVRKMNFPFPFLWNTILYHWEILSWHCFEMLESHYPITHNNNPEEQNSELAYLTTMSWTCVGSGSVAPCIFNLIIRWRWVVSFMSQALLPLAKNCGTQWTEGWVPFSAVLDMMVKTTICDSARKHTGAFWFSYPRT
jgi:hypothetical protein